MGGVTPLPLLMAEAVAKAAAAMRRERILDEKTITFAGGSKNAVESVLAHARERFFDHLLLLLLLLLTQFSVYFLMFHTLPIHC